jgi:hypothetical protein
MIYNHHESVLPPKKLADAKLYVIVKEKIVD